MIVHRVAGCRWWLLVITLGTCVLLSAGCAGVASAAAGVSCVSSHDCWAVGGTSALHWDGKRWSAVSAGTHQPGQLTAVSCTSRSDCWAVGYLAVIVNGAASDLNQAVHWNGSKWSSVSTPNPAGTGARDFNVLKAVSCVSASDCWAVGFSRTSRGPGISPELIEALRWNGSAWSRVATPEPGGTTGQTSDYNLDPSSNALSGVSCISHSNCWAVGTFRPAGDYSGSDDGLAPPSFTLALHWNGSAWSRTRTPQPAGDEAGHFDGLSGVWCLSRSNCWAVGNRGFFNSDYEGGGNSLDEIFYWNGSSWSAVKAPQPDGTRAYSGNILNGITCASAKDCWAVGDLGQPNGDNVVLRWNGTRWKRVPVPHPPDSVNFLRAISCTSRSNCWATGDVQTRHGPSGIRLRWNGTDWSRYTRHR